MQTGELPFLGAAYAPMNIEINREALGSYWRDWGNDIFDSWGFFYIFDVTTREYYGVSQN